MPDIRKVDMRKELVRMSREVGPADWNIIIPDDAQFGTIPQSEIDAKWNELFSDIPRWSRPWWLLWLLGRKRLLKLLPSVKDKLLRTMKATPEYRDREDALWLWAAGISYLSNGRMMHGRK